PIDNPLQRCRRILSSAAFGTKSSDIRYPPQPLLSRLTTDSTHQQASFFPPERAYHPGRPPFFNKGSMDYADQGQPAMTALSGLSEERRPGLLERVRDTLRTRHSRIRTEDAYVQWIKRFLLFHGKRHPLEMGEREVEDFLTHLARAAKV